MRLESGPSLRFSSRGLAPPKIFDCCNPSAKALTGSLTVLGSNFNLGLAAASSVTKTKEIVFDLKTVLVFDFTIFVNLGS